MWEQKRKRPDEGNNFGDSTGLKRKIPKFKSSDDIDAVLAEQERKDAEEQERKYAEGDETESEFCGC